MTTMGVKQLQKVKEWVAENNSHNPDMKVFLDVREGMLLSIHVVFYRLRKQIDEKTEDEVYKAIKILSHQKLFPEKTGNLKNGILRINANYIHQRCVANDTIRALNYIRDDMPRIINGK